VDGAKLNDGAAVVDAGNAGGFDDGDSFEPPAEVADDVSCAEKEDGAGDP
jgi:hypothetical protein